MTLRSVKRKLARSALLLTAAPLLAAPPACTAAGPGAATAPATMPAHTNRLAKEKSPYLLQHAHNPVDWYPWGEAAFAKARKENKPIFLSIGYSTCHWCHVMERESFENEEVAKLINEHFVPIKIDREERPDIDRVYMTFVQATTGSGGWPMTVFLTPELQPFYGGTYFPPVDRGEMTGMKTLLPRVAQIWRDDREKVVKSAGKITEMLKEAAAGGATTKPAEDAVVSPLMLKTAFGRFESTFDEKWGGFGESPKFPEPVNMHYLLRYAHTAPDEKTRAGAKAIVIKTLDAMAAGGMYDHVGGGFHRYSTDERWFLPHFEKMLYDQGQLAVAYVDAWRVTKEQKYATVARETLDYVLRDLTGPDGQFYCAEDADSARDASKPRDKVEGAFYVWSAQELEQVLGKEPAAVVAAHFGVSPKGNVERDRHGDFTGLNILYVSRSVEATAKELNKTPADVSAILAEAKNKLLAVRAKRPRPHLDDKTLTAWSGLMISGFAHASAAFGEERYESAAVRAAAFLKKNLYDEKTHTLKRGYREGQGDANGFLEDYAFLIQGLLDLYETSLDSQWLAWALDLQTRQDAIFWDDKAGGYFSSPGDDPHLLVRMKDDSDGAEPCGNSVAAMNLLRLAQMTDDAKLAQRAKQTFNAFGTRLRATPLALPYMLAATDFASSKPRQIVIAGKPGSPEVKKLLAEVHRRYVPNRIVLSADGGTGQALLVAKLPFIKEMKPIDGKAAAYVCQNYACQQPTADPGELAKQLEK